LKITVKLAEDDQIIENYNSIDLFRSLLTKIDQLMYILNNYIYYIINKLNN